MVDYARLAATAQRLIGNAGRTITLQNRSTTLVNPAEPWQGTTSTGTSVSVTGVFLDYEDDQIDGTLVQQGDRQVLVADTSVGTFPISAGTTTLQDGTVTYAIESVSPINPGTQNVMYTLQIRGN